MKTNSTQLEIIVMTGTSFATRQFSPKKDGQDEQTPAGMETLKEAFWNGLLPELLPEICEQIPAGKKMFLWDIKEADTFIELEMGEQKENTDRYFSINPYTFLPEHPLS
jgi:hypothetical protein